MKDTEAFFYLRASQNGDGGWGYSEGHGSVLEATATAMLALTQKPDGTEAVAMATRWLLAAQHDDGGWGLAADDPESGWQTAWAGLVLARLGGNDEALRRAARWLLNVNVWEFDQSQPNQGRDAVLNIDLRLHGWAWLPNQSSWVEPTALAMLALQASPLAAEAQAQLEEAVRYLQDRRCRDGGWNFGNPYMFDAALPARAHPTAFAILALVAVSPDAILLADLELLRQEARQEGSALALGLAALALQAAGEGASEELASLATLQGPDGSWDASPHRTAVALLALQGGL
ncbi:MAG: hypothetical protein ACUVWR_03985 [Anaerolineae bacterium]